MNLSTMHGRVLRILNTNADQYPKATTFTDDLNEALSLRTLDILRLKGYRQVTATQSYTDLKGYAALSEGNNGYNGEYGLPTDLLDITRVEINKKCYTNDADSWYVVDGGQIYDMKESDRSEHDATNINAGFESGSPQVRIGRGSLFIRPLPVYDVTSGLWIFYKQRQDALSGDSATPDFESNLHQILLYDCAEMEITAHPESYSTTKRNMVSQKRDEVEKDFEEFYRSRLRQDQQLQTVSESFK